MLRVIVSIIAVIAFFVAISEPTFTSFPWPNAIAVVVFYLCCCYLWPEQFIEDTTK